jgi:uracil phosphoribosyltransferase
MTTVHVSRHPLLVHRVATLRERSTPPPEFRRMVREIAQLLFWEAATSLETSTVTVTTPLAECPAEKLSQTVGLVPILRAGLGMAEAILDWVPDAQVWHLGLFRQHEDARPITYYDKIRAGAKLDTCFVLDPMLATGGSAIAAIAILRKAGVANIHFLGLIAAPEGVAALQAAHPDVPIHLAALDTHLNADKYIVPGLGDAGDRQFAT